MYADRFDQGPRFRPASLGAALAINGAVLAALFFAQPDLIRAIKPPPLTIIAIDLPLNPPPEPQPHPRATHPVQSPPEQVTATVPIIDPVTPNQVDVTPQPTATPTADPGPLTTIDPPLAPPPFVAASTDPRYAGDFQPPYPDVQRDMGVEGVVRLKVLIGVDGRVKRVERIDGAADFYRAASTHALARWRFRPATRGGIPEESWRIMAVRFQIAS